MKLRSMFSPTNLFESQPFDPRLDLAQVPEPSGALVMIGAAAAMLVRRRRRQS
jgi:hypothetical protein